MGAYIGEMGVVSCLFSGLEYISGSGIRREGRRGGGGVYGWLSQEFEKAKGVIMKLGRCEKADLIILHNTYLNKRDPEWLVI